MRRSVTVAVLSVVVLLAGGCQKQERPPSAVATDVSADAPVKPLPSGTLTLSVEQLGWLDWSRPAASRPKVVAQRVVEGVGVEFDIQFPSNRPGARSVDYVSSGSGGRGVMVGLDVQGYETFALKFTLLSVDGAAGSALPHQVVVGALTGPTADGKVFGYKPLSLAFASGRVTGIAQTPLGLGRIRQIGIHVHMENPDVWSSDKTLLTLRVEPVSDAAVLAVSPVLPEASARKSSPRREAPGSPKLAGPSRLGTW